MYNTLNKGGSRTGAQGARPRFKNIVGFVFVNFDCITRKYTLIVVNMQCVQYIFYSLLYESIGGVNGQQNSPQTPKFLPRWDRAPGFEIYGSATAK